jgi:hypothetical protein
VWFEFDSAVVILDRSIKSSRLEAKPSPAEERFETARIQFDRLFEILGSTFGVATRESFVAALSQCIRRKRSLSRIARADANGKNRCGEYEWFGQAESNDETF